jgi:phosphoenolpyruvate carboxykinase (ATP)
VQENVVIDPRTGDPDYEDIRYTENTRAAYPVEFIENAIVPGVGGQPANVLFLAADAFGVLPPIAKLNPEQAMYHFLSGYTAKLAGTEAGLGSEPVPEFSTCFASPFLPLAPKVYAAMLGERLRQYGAQCWLVNTGWTGGKYGVGRRMPIKVTRALLSAALDGSLADVEMRIDPHFRFRVPIAVRGIDSAMLNPRDTWADIDAYDEMAKKLSRMFRDNFKKFEKHVADDVLSAAPGLAEAAE